MTPVPNLRINTPLGPGEAYWEKPPIHNRLVSLAAVVFFLVAFGFVVRDYVLPDPPVAKDMINSRFVMSNGPCTVVLECKE